MPISWLDVILIVIMLISGFLAMVRGFTREVLSIFSWAVAAVAALYLSPKYSSLLVPYINNQSVAQIVFPSKVVCASQSSARSSMMWRPQPPSQEPGSR